MDRRLLLASSLALIASVFFVVGPLSYHVERVTGENACVCLTVWHPLPQPPPPPPPGNATRQGAAASVALGAVAAGLILNFALLMRQEPGLVRRAGIGILVVSAVSLALGDEFLIAGVLGLAAGIGGLMQGRGVR